MRVYYNCVGWPTFLPTSDQEVFAAKVYQLKQQQMKKLVQQGGIPLRDGVVQVGAGTLIRHLLVLIRSAGSAQSRFSHRQGKR